MNYNPKNNYCCLLKHKIVLPGGIFVNNKKESVITPSFPDFVNASPKITHLFYVLDDYHCALSYGAQKLKS